jgi:hypothetical protein
MLFAHQIVERKGTELHGRTAILDAAGDDAVQQKCFSKAAAAKEHYILIRAMPHGVSKIQRPFFARAI